MEDSQDTGYAGFWIRCGAALIDTLLFAVVISISMTLIYSDAYWFNFSSNETTLGFLGFYSHPSGTYCRHSLVLAEIYGHARKNNIGVENSRCRYWWQAKYWPGNRAVCGIYNCSATFVLRYFFGWVSTNESRAGMTS